MAQRGSQQGPLAGIFKFREWVPDPLALNYSSFALTASATCNDTSTCGVINFEKNFRVSKSDPRRCLGNIVLEAISIPDTYYQAPVNPPHMPNQAFEVGVESLQNPSWFVTDPVPSPSPPPAHVKKLRFDALVTSLHPTAPWYRSARSRALTQTQLSPRPTASSFLCHHPQPRRPAPLVRHPQRANQREGSVSVVGSSHLKGAAVFGDEMTTTTHSAAAAAAFGDEMMTTTHSAAAATRAARSATTATSDTAGAVSAVAVTTVNHDPYHLITAPPQ